MGDEWRETSLAEVLELKRGYDLPKRDRIHGSVPVISSSGVTDYHTVCKVSGPGVVTGRYGTLGNVYYIKEDFWPHNTTLYVRDFKGNDPRFISYFLRGLDFLSYSDKAAVPGLNRNHMHTARVLFPVDIKEQRAIAQVLGTLDDKIELNRRMNETLEAIARALFKSWFVDFDPVRAKMAGRDTGLPPHIAALFPDRLAHSELGKIPAGWAVKPLGEVLEITGGGTPSTKEPGYWTNGSHAFCTPKDMAQLDSPALLFTERLITDAGVEKISSGQLPSGTLLMSSRAPIGYLAISDIPVSINQGIIAIPPGQSLPVSYLQHWARINLDMIKAYASGSTFLEITKRNFRLISMLVPPATVLSKFDRKASVLHERMVVNMKQSQELASLRDTLLPKLMSGEVKV